MSEQTREAQSPVDPGIPDLAFLASTEVMGALSEPAIVDIARRMEACALEDGEALLREGDQGDHLYVLVSGRLRVNAPGLMGSETLLAELEPGAMVGEMAFLTGDARMATVNAVGGTRLLRLSRDSFIEFARTRPLDARKMIEPMVRQLRRARLASALRLSGAFASFEEQVFRDFESELETVTVPGGATLFEQGDPGHCLYFVVSGRLRVLVQHPDGSSTAVADLGAGETVGEMALVTGEPRSATVVAIRDSLLARLSRDGYERVLTQHPRAVSQAVTTRIVARLAHTNSAAPARNSGTLSLALLPAGPAAPLKEFCSLLERSFQRLGKTLHLTSESIDGQLGKANISQTPCDDLDNIRIVQWLGQAETDNRYLIYEADHRDTNWNRRCVRQADHILLVGVGGEDHRPGIIETEAFSGGVSMATRSLVLVQPRQGRAAGTLPWLQARSIARHYHVRLPCGADMDRLARLLAGKALGLALGGGFARGLAHVGVFRALDDIGIPVDLVGGSSMGAVIGALWAQEWDYDRMVRETSTACVGALNDLTFPFIAFQGGKKFSNAIRSFTGDIQIEDLPLPYFCVSANLNRVEMKLHNRGELLKAVLASTRAPGIFPPIVYDGELHVDGGVLNNVPVDLVKQFCEGGRVIGVDVSPPHELNLIQDYGTEMSGWEAFRRRFGRFGRSKSYVPSILLVMMRALEFGGVSYKKLIANSADLYLQPPLLQFKRTDFALASQIVDVTYGYARTEIERWLDKSGGVSAPDSHN